MINNKPVISDEDQVIRTVAGIEIKVDRNGKFYAKIPTPRAFDKYKVYSRGALPQLVKLIEEEMSAGSVEAMKVSALTYADFPKSDLVRPVEVQKYTRGHFEYTYRVQPNGYIYHEQTETLYRPDTAAAHRLNELGAEYARIAREYRDIVGGLTKLTRDDLLRKAEPAAPAE